jgi:hypothetical protein
MVYPHSWPSLGTTEEQFVSIVWQTGERVRVPVPQSSLANPDELRQNLHKALRAGSEPLAQKVRTAQFDYSSMLHGVEAEAKKIHQALVDAAIPSVEKELKAAVVADIHDTTDIEGVQKMIKKSEEATKVSVAKAEASVKSLNEIYVELLNEALAKLDEETRQIADATKDSGFEAWVHAYRNVLFGCRIEFDRNTNRFTIRINTKIIKSFEMSEQLAYMSGFEKSVINESTTARFMPDLNGGVSSLHVYSPGLIEPMIIGDVYAPVLRIVTIRGAQDEIIEEQFIAIQYHKILVKEISEIFVEIRTSNGALMPFQYGTCTLTLHFKKAAYF